MLADIVWAKSSPTGGLSLIRHMLDAAAVAYELVAQRRSARRRAASLGVDEVSFQRWIAFFVGCHDLGKATPGFQQKWPEGRQRDEEVGLSFPAGAPGRHDASSGFYFKRVLAGLGVEMSDAGLIADAVAAHHGFIVEPTEIRQVGMFDRVLADGWQRTMREAADYLAATVGLDGKPQISRDRAVRAEFAVWLAGFCSVCDWIASNQSYFPLDRRDKELPAWWGASRELAHEALADAGLTYARAGQARSASQCLGLALPAGLQARPLQHLVAELLPGLGPGPALIVIEAPMGEGKTEAAFIADAWFRSNAGLSGTYFAMPTQATSNALFGRLAEYLGRLGGAEIQVQLAHGASRFGDVLARLAQVGFGPENRSVTAAAWLTGQKRTLLCPNAVGTVDQALVGVLNARHHFVRLFGLSERLVVLDEVHAYDSYTGGLIERLISWLCQQGCSVVVMSATLPQSRRISLVRAFGSPDKGESQLAPYPRITVSNAGRVVATGFQSSRRFRVTVEAAPSDLEPILSSVRSAADAGARVLAVVNKVARAQALHSVLTQNGVDSTLFHARFPMDQRLEIEKTVLERFGKHGTAHGGCVLVATQVAEQSLDVDFDVLLTDLAPVDLVLQRVGRVHRHERARPAGFKAPRVLVCGLDESEVPPLALTDRVYAAATVLRSALYLRRHRVLEMPQAIDHAVQWVYGSEKVDQVSPEFAAAYGTAEKRLAETLAEQRRLAELAALPLPADWPPGNAAVQLDDDAAAEGGELFGTRLGQPSLSLIPILRCGDRYSIHGVQGDWDIDSPVPAHAALMLSRRYLRISHPALVRVLRRQAPIPGWTAHAALSGHHPLVLDDTRSCVLAGWRVTLDSQLGLLIERQMQ